MLSVAQVQQQPAATLDLTIKPDAFMEGTSATLQAILTNNSDKQIIFDLAYDCGFDLGLGIDVSDGRGYQPPETRHYRAAKGEDIGREPDGLRLVCAGDFGLHGVMPRETLKTTVDLSQVYDIPPGKYTVRVTRVDTNHAVVQSNPVAITVLPNPNYVEPCTVSGSVSMTVNDPSGSVVPSALVILRPEGTGTAPPIAAAEDKQCRSNACPSAVRICGCLCRSEWIYALCA